MFNFNFNLAILNFIVGLVPAMEALMEAQEGLYNKAEVMETAFLQALEKEGVYNSSVQRVDEEWAKARRELKALEQEEEEAFWALLEIFGEVPAVSLVSRLHQAQKAVEEAQKAFSCATSQRTWADACISSWQAEKALAELETQLLEFPGDDPVLFEAKVRLMLKTV